MPDVVSFADFVQSGASLCDDLSGRWRSYVPDHLEAFPYPNGSKHRIMAIARCPDLVMLRTAGERVIRTTDQMLSDRVLSSRLDPHGAPPWSFKDPRKAWTTFRNMPSELAVREPLAGALVADVANYFGSIDYQLLGRSLHELECDLDAISVVMNMLLEWARAGNIMGLPIGPETCSVLGNAFLLPLDAALSGSGFTHFRYMDDIVVVGTHLQEQDVVNTVDRALNTLRLRRNDDKTRPYAAGRAAEALQDMLFTYIGPRGGATNRRMDPDELRAVLEDEAEELYPDAKRLRFALRGLDGGAALRSLTEHPSLLNADPREACRYMATYGLRTQGVRDALMEAATTAGDGFAGLRLHSLLACTGASWGGSEGRVFASIATSETERAPVRCHAWHAATHSPAWKPVTAMEAAHEEHHPAVRRAIVLTLRRAPQTRSKVAFLKKMAADEYVKYAVRWADVA